MKKLLCLLLTVLLALGGISAWAEEVNGETVSDVLEDEYDTYYDEELTLSGALKPAAEKTVTAPFGGTVLACGLHAGDAVKAGDALFELDTIKVYAPADGIIAAVLVTEGQSLASSVYEAPIWLEPASQFIINATIAGANNSTETKYIHAGEKVFVHATVSDERKANGLVTSVSGTSYTVEVLDGNLRINESCNISRSDDPDDSKLRIGSGRAVRNDPVAVTGEGSVLKLHVKQGDAVKRGELIMETVRGDIAGKGLTDGIIRAETDCVITGVSVSAGMAVQERQAALTLYERGALEAVVSVDENDLSRIKVGDTVTVELDCASGERLFEGVVRSIDYTASANDKGVMYDAHVTFENDDFVRMGMSVTVRK